MKLLVLLASAGVAAGLSSAAPPQRLACASGSSRPQSVNSLQPVSRLPPVKMQSMFTRARTTKLAVFVGATAASVRFVGPPGATLARAFGGSLAATLSGIIDSHAAVSYGYGASLVWLAT
eukprot:1274406-Prymnesium_polylepis.1